MKLDDAQSFEDRPHTDRKAKAIKWEPAAANRKIIEVIGARYRNAVLNGMFLVADSHDAYGTSKDGFKTIEVECRWYGWRPKSRWIRLTLTSQETEIANSGNEIVIKDIGR